MRMLFLAYRGFAYFLLMVAALGLLGTLTETPIDWAGVGNLLGVGAVGTLMAFLPSRSRFLSGQPQREPLSRDRIRELTQAITLGDYLDSATMTFAKGNSQKFALTDEQKRLVADHADAVIATQLMALFQIATLDYETKTADGLILEGIKGLRDSPRLQGSPMHRYYATHHSGAPSTADVVAWLHDDWWPTERLRLLEHMAEGNSRISLQTVTQAGCDTYILPRAQDAMSQHKLDELVATINTLTLGVAGEAGLPMGSS